jgi:hypothetical protein
MWDYHDNTKSEYQIDCFRAFCATRSIIGEKSYCKTNKALIYARMFGFASPKVLPSKMPKVQAKYAVRYHMDKVLLSLQNDWYLKLTSDNSRGMYISYEMTLKDLMLQELKAKKSTKDAQLKTAKTEARAAAMQEMSMLQHKISKPIPKVEKRDFTSDPF